MNGDPLLFDKVQQMTLEGQPVRLRNCKHICIVNGVARVGLLHGAVSSMQVIHNIMY